MRALFAATAITIAIAGCETMEENPRTTGTIGGAAAGAAVGAALDDDKPMRGAAMRSPGGAVYFAKAAGWHP